MKRTAVFMLLAGLMAPACSEKELIGNMNESRTAEITAIMAEQGTKTEIGSDGKTVFWNPEDTINVFYGKSKPITFISANLEPVQATVFYGPGMYFGNIENSDQNNCLWAVYPAQDGQSCDGESVTLSIPSHQKCVPGTFDRGSFPAIGRSQTTSIPFYNVCGGIRFKLVNDGITGISFKGNNGETLAGKVKVTFGDGKPVVKEVLDGEETIILTGEFVAGKWYYISILPCELKDGFTMRFTNEKIGTAAEIKVHTSKTINRSIFGSVEDIDDGTIWEYDCVDLGLSVMWATCNLGAISPEKYGNYYAWGEIETKPSYDVTTYKWYKKTIDGYATVYEPIKYDETKIILDSEDDAVFKARGGKWRMPTAEEFGELRTQCKQSWTTQNGVYGRKFTSRINGNSIFFPAAGYRNKSDLIQESSYGYYWTLSIGSTDPQYFNFTSGSASVGSGAVDRYMGLPVRPVYGELIGGVRLDRGVVSIVVGTECPLEATVYNLQNIQVTWSSSNTSVATVNDNGVVTGISKGIATITVKTIDGEHTASCDVTVNECANPTPGTLIDLGLSVKWASFNLGASKPEEYGNYYAWGETETKSTYDWSTYKWCNGSSTTMTKYCVTASSGVIDDKIVLEPDDDVAHIILGGNWRMPTIEEWEELISNCSSALTSLNGIYGCQFTSSKNGNSIFLPAAEYFDFFMPSGGSFGAYWSSSLNTDYSYNSRCIRFYFNENGLMSSSILRFYGLTIRPVCE